MKIQEMKEKYFSNSFKRVAKSANVGVQFVRTIITYKREAIELANGDFILTSSKTIIFKREKPDYSDHKTRPEGYYRIGSAFDIGSIAYWSGDAWLCHGDENEYWDYELDLKSIELVELKTS